MNNLPDLELPEEITIRLDGRLREGLKRIADLFRHESDPDLLALVLRRGIQAMLQEQHGQLSPAQTARNRNEAQTHARELGSTDVLPGSGLSTKAQRSDSNHVPFGMKRTLHEQHVMDARYDQETARIKRDLGLADFPERERENHRGPVPLPHVERYVAAPISEELRQRLEDFLNEHPELDRERCIAALLGLGLDKAEMIFMEKGQGLNEKKADQMLRLAERLCARAKRRCV